MNIDRLGRPEGRNDLRPFTGARAALVCSLALAFALGNATRARAEGIALDRYVPAPLPSDGFYMNRPNDLGQFRIAANLQLDYANDPLVVELSPGSKSSERAAVVHDHMVGHAILALGLFDHLMLFVGADVHLLMRGDSLAGTGQSALGADGAGLGDMNAGLRLRLIGERDDMFGLALQGRVTFPLARAADASENFRGDKGLTVTPELIAELRPKPLRITASLGGHFRRTVELPNAPVRSGIPFGLGLTLTAVKPLDLIVELHGETAFKDFFKRATTPLELLGGFKVWLGESGFVLGAAAGPGLNRGIGAPDYRLVGLLGFEQPESKPLPPPPPGDRDHDGILDPVDACPAAPEDKDGFEDADGCPDLDNDKDGISDKDDRCVNEPEDKDGFEDDDGCPDPDNDKDGIADAADKCPNEAEDTDDFEDTDGCPDPDNDQDGVPDTSDRCPENAGPPENQGCPKVVIEQGQIRILERIEFATGKDTIRPESNSILEAVSDLLGKKPDIKRVRVEGHTDDRGPDKTNLTLSRKRAQAVVKWLTGHGVEVERLEAWGCGERYPLMDNEDADGRQTNRRVEFHILDPKTDGAVERSECQEAKPTTGKSKK